MKYFVIPKSYYNKLYNIDFSRLLMDIESIGFKVLKDYRISSYDMYLLLQLNNMLGLNKELLDKINKVYDYDKPNFKYTFKEFLKDWLDVETDDDTEINLCEYKPYNTDFMVIIVNYNFFAELLNDINSTKWIDHTLDYLYSNFGEKLVIDSELLRLKYKH